MVYQEEWKEPFLSSPSFAQCEATKKLTELALNPPNLREVVSEERMVSLSAYGAGILLLFGFQRVDGQILNALQKLSDERQAVTQMKALFTGEKVNWIEGCESEERAVLHPSLRDLFDVPVSPVRPVRQEVEAELHKIRTFFTDKVTDFTTLLFIGIGGSALGPHALVEALEPYHLPGKEIHYIANVDPDEMTSALSKIDLKKTLVAIVSKSGTTLETATNEARIRDAFERSAINAQEHCIAVTMPGTPMDDQTKYKEVFHLFDFVGGRFSSSSVVGAVPIAFMVGVNAFFELLDGASEMDRLALRGDIRDNLPLLLALLSVWNRNFLNLPTTAVIPYAKSLHRFPAHLQQCSMESNGKSVDRTGQKVSYPTGQIVWGEPGTNAQHSFFQLLHQGTDVVPVEFIGFKETQYSEDFSYKGTTSHEKLTANLLAQALALATGKDSENPNRYFEGNRPSTLILAKKLDAHALGALLSLYENKIVFEGFLWGINSFDQEGVQFGKVLAESLLTAIQKRKEGKEDITAPLVGRRLLDLVDDLAVGRAVLPESKSHHVT